MASREPASGRPTPAAGLTEETPWLACQPARVDAFCLMKRQVSHRGTRRPVSDLNAFRPDVDGWNDR